MAKSNKEKPGMYPLTLVQEEHERCGNRKCQDFILPSPSRIYFLLAVLIILVSTGFYTLMMSCRYMFFSFFGAEADVRLQYLVGCHCIGLYGGTSSHWHYIRYF